MSYNIFQYYNKYNNNNYINVNILIDNIFFLINLIDWVYKYLCLVIIQNIIDNILDF